MRELTPPPATTTNAARHNGRRLGRHRERCPAHSEERRGLGEAKACRPQPEGAFASSQVAARFYLSTQLQRQPKSGGALDLQAIIATEQGKIVISGGLLAASLIYKSYERTRRLRQVATLFTIGLTGVQASDDWLSLNGTVLPVARSRRKIINASLYFTSQAVLPAVLRSLYGRPPIGSTPVEKLAFFVIGWCERSASNRDFDAWSIPMGASAHA